eukprot:48331-Eustigmatos_ZCMA.PRE.1
MELIVRIAQQVVDGLGIGNRQDVSPYTGSVEYLVNDIKAPYVQAVARLLAKELVGTLCSVVCIDK